MDYTPEQEKIILAANPFEGDMDCNFRYLKNKMGKARKYAQCRNCLTNIHPGDICRMMSCVFEDDHEIVHGKYCKKCCDALAKDPSGEKFADRFADGPSPTKAKEEGL